ncbi:hypothetical protein EBZ39_19105 [bacterium]|nr:hypothetical protein [bacterium]
MKSNFVIFCQQRTGSSVLTSALNKQKDIFCLKELFKRKMIYSSLFENENIKNFLGEDRSKWDKNRNEKFKEFLNIISESSNKKIFGYKFFEKHFQSVPSEEAYLNFLKENNSKIIILERKNILLQYISLLTARSIGLYTSNIKKPETDKVYKINPIKINYYSYIQYNKKIKELYIKKLKDTQDYHLPYINITYEDFTGKNFEESFKKIFNFLDLKFDNFIDTRIVDTIASHKKINIYKNKDKILNYTKFKEQAEKNNDIETLNFLEEK